MVPTLAGDGGEGLGRDRALLEERAISRQARFVPKLK
jgi:hypothetical protein